MSQTCDQTREFTHLLQYIAYIQLGATVTTLFSLRLIKYSDSYVCTGRLGEKKSNWSVYVFIDFHGQFPFSRFPLTGSVCWKGETWPEEGKRLLKWIKWEGWRANLREWQKKKEGGKEENRDSRTKLTAPVLSPFFPPEAQGWDQQIGKFSPAFLFCSPLFLFILIVFFPSITENFIPVTIWSHPHSTFVWGPMIHTQSRICLTPKSIKCFYHLLDLLLTACCLPLVCYSVRRQKF